MTNKKFKVAAMSMALTACVAAQPLIANAADDVNAVSNDAPDSAPQSEGESPASAPVAAASVSSDPVTNQKSEGAVDVIGDPDISVDYNHDNDKVTKDDSSTTTESTGPVNRDVPKESEPGAQQPETDLNNEQEGPKDGGSETEKKPIGEAEKSETETKDTKLVLGEPTTTTTTTTNPDGSTTTTTTTTTDAALETTTKVEGEASAKTEEDSSEDVKGTLKEELDGALRWDTEPNTKFGDYTVTDAVETDGTKTFTLTKEDKIEGEMTGLDISKLIEAGYKDNGDGTYTLTKEFTDSQGQKQTTTVKVDSSTATKITRTTLTVTMANQNHEKTEELGTKEDTNYPYPSTDITVQDDKGKDHTFNVTDILGKAHDNGDGTFTYEDKENNLTYTITKNETDTKLDSLTDTELRDLLNQNTTGSKYSVDADGKLCYTTDQGEVCRVTNEQNTLLRSMLKLGITITDHHGKESDTQKVDGSEKTPEQAKADAKETAQDEALKDALAQAINKEAGKSLTKADIDLSKANGGKFEWTDPDTDKTYTFSYTEKGIVSSSEKIKDPSTVKPDASSAEKNTETGSAEVTGSTVIWTEEGKTLIQNDSKTETAFGKDFDFRSVPGGFELDGDAVYNNDGTLQSFKTKDGKTYEFTYTPGSAPEDLKDISHPDFTTVTWKMTEKKIDSITSPDTSEPTHIEIERNFRKKTEDNGTFTFTETKEGGKTYSGLKKVDGTDNVYRSEDGSVTITVTTSELGVGVNEIKAALEGKGYTDVKVNSDGTASYKDGNVTYNVTYNTTVESITVKTKEVVEDSRFTISVSDSKQQDAEDALKAKIAELQAGLEEGEYIEVNGHHVDQHTEVETIITYFKTAINYKNMSDDEIVAMLKKQKADADAEGKSYTGAGIGHDYLFGHYDTGETPNYIGHLDLATDSDLVLEDGSTADAILLNKGDKKFKFEWNMDAEDLVNKNKPDKRAKFQDSISYDDGKQNGGDGSKGHYEYERGNGRSSWIDKDNDQYPHASAYYRLTGTIAYNSLEDGKEYGTWNDANNALADWVKDHPNDKDYKPNIVALQKTETDWWGNEYTVTVYKAYTYESSLTAYGYMSKDSNTCVNSGYGDTGYGRAWAGGFDLRISGLTQVTKTESSAHGKNYYDYYADITKYKTVEQTSRPLTNRLLNVIPGTKTEPTETTNTDTGSGLFGSYDQNHNETHNYEKPFTGAGTAEYTTYRTWEDTNAEWDGEFEKLTGAFGFSYTSTKDAEVVEASKKACVKTDSSVKYHYSYVERQELDPITETKTVTTPADDDGDDDGDDGDDGGDEIIEEKVPDSPVLPGTPELPPVQDAKPDAPVLPADPALPAVQDAHALPQTGVNWLAAIGLALSGMTLMITGAFASLTGKNAKH
ncbi:hypothetical protein [Faecalibacterium wellingii]|uniref:LPXTG cell wall anchor domain-containing protein n=1 Tax=Faecalibacterium wellingii TaxID=2929491 RepID=A0ABU3U0D7_9FIRM|nr:MULTISPECIES: hypothetical protein [Faecalibacterium]MDU8689023.1 hypothetical protein [Faecalibacterium prausnitzii]UQK56385.1 hypothetical protein MTP37_12230 [Faecalibacterium sp. HTF-F]